MSLSIPSINFGVLERSGAQQLCIVLDMQNLDQRETDLLAQELREKKLECLDAIDGNEYCQKFFLDRGIVVFTKEHDPFDTDHSYGMDLGVTVKQAFEAIKMTFNERYKSVQIHPLAHQNLQAFLTSFQAIGLDAAKTVMPELGGIEDVLEDVKQPEPAKSEGVSTPQPQRLKSFIYWLIGGLAILAAYYLARQALAHKK